ncbi:testis-expressed protein 9 [Chrysoperla carnea]|uniref:testis-expressed protein 9 n=1 Tax=Chrysoperla carnea TaxID=189513 RepID=UPI001D08BE94|nr:testis-expressed protein 9 [Chrysoperla carnea]
MLQQRLQLKETENHCLRKEIDGLKKDLRSQGSMTSSSEVRLNRALEEIERLKYNIKENKMELKEARESNGKELQELRIKNKRLENQKADLSNAVKKQSLLIDNLKRQKLHLEASKLLNITEEEFLKILDWTITSKSDSPKTVTKDVKVHNKVDDVKVEEVNCQ